MLYIKMQSNRLIHQMRNLTASVRLVSAAANTGPPSPDTRIVIPKAIKRGPTDILEALASTVQKDYTGPSYKFIDDPFLTPTSSRDKRMYSLSKEAGRRAALYFLDKFPQHFHRDTSEPKIEAYSYKEVFDDSMEFDEVDLVKCITRSDISNAIICYTNLVKQNKEITEETLFDLLDLVAFYNNEDVSERFVEEEWFKKTDTHAEKIFWNDNGFAEQLFESLPNKNDRAYCSLIQGMCKHSQSKRAFNLYEKAIDSGMKLNVGTYNALITSSYDLSTSNDERWSKVVELLHKMRNNGIRPNIGTLNSVLHQISIYKYWQLNYEYGIKTFNEFALKFGIEPSLATYYYLLRIFYKNRQSQSSIIHEILDKINSKTLQLQHSHDVYFLPEAMNICANLNDVQLAYKVNDIAERNPKLLGKGPNTNHYYSKYFNLLLTSESFENFMIIYTKYVPHIFTPTFEMMEQIFNEIKTAKAMNYVPQVWSDLILLGYSYRIELLQEFLGTMNEIKKGDPLLPTFNNLILSIIQRIDKKIEQAEETSFKDSIKWTAKCLSYCISILVKAENIDSAFKVLQKLDILKFEVFDPADAQSLINFCNAAISINNFEMVKFCIIYCKEMDRLDITDAIMKDVEHNSLVDDKLREEIKKLA